MSIDLIFSSDCPNVDEARHNLREALIALDMNPQWTEWNADADDAPPWTRAFGSPTVLIDGADVQSDDVKLHATCCRVYPDRKGTLAGSPSSEDIAACIRRRASD